MGDSWASYAWRCSGSLWLVNARGWPLQPYWQHQGGQSSPDCSLWFGLWNVWCLVAQSAQQTPCYSSEARLRCGPGYAAPPDVQHGGEEWQAEGARVPLLAEAAGLVLHPHHLPDGGHGLAAVPAPPPRHAHQELLRARVHGAALRCAGLVLLHVRPRCPGRLRALRVGGRHLHLPELRGQPHAPARGPGRGPQRGLGPLRRAPHHERRPELVVRLVDELPELPDRAPPVPLHAPVPPPQGVPPRARRVREARRRVRQHELLAGAARDLRQPGQGRSRRVPWLGQDGPAVWGCARTFLLAVGLSVFIGVASTNIATESECTFVSCNILHQIIFSLFLFVGFTHCCTHNCNYSGFVCS
mmetsp:Transcript_12060/g.16738  ORF Transcript_12060/g.16738 Transcript_12060/m.16738 type:complete len:357 (-) Transcript_12060:189-1259(-)